MLEGYDPKHLSDLNVLKRFYPTFHFSIWQRLLCNTLVIPFPSFENLEKAREAAKALRQVYRVDAVIVKDYVTQSPSFVLVVIEDD